MRVVLAFTVVAVASACGGKARLPVEAGTGLAPTLPAPERSTIPVVKVARAVGWPAGTTPTPAEGLAVRAFATGLSHPRNLYVLPNGDVLVAESNAPAGRDEGHGIRAWFMKRYFKKAGAAVPSADRITLLRDADGDGVAETRTTFLAKLHSPYGMALVGDRLYVGNTDAVVRFPYREGATSIGELPVEVKLLPAGRVNHHWTKNLVASADGRRLYVAVGSNSNVGERGMAFEEGRAAIHEIDLASGRDRLFATGMRNPVGMAWEPETGALWVVVNERDELGSDLVPDYLTRVREGGFYGWPYSYYGQHVDARAKPPRPDLVATAIAPDYALGPHTASLGLAAAPASLLPSRYARGMFVGQHGSWNRKPLSGYRVVFVPFANATPTGAQPLPVLDGFLDADEHARGRPVAVAVDRRGALLVADDVGNTVWRVIGSK